MHPGDFFFVVVAKLPYEFLHPCETKCSREFTLNHRAKERHYFISVISTTCFI